MASGIICIAARIKILGTQAMRVWQSFNALLAMSIVGCAHSGVVRTGPDTYMVANSDWGFNSGSVEKAKAVGEADKYCQSMGREILVISSTQNDVAFGKTPAAEVDFKCLQKGDPELTKKTLQ